MGSSGGNNNAQRQADANEAARQAQIAQTTASINSVFNDPSRTAQYDKLASDTTQYYTNDLNKQQALNSRKLKFALARSGLNGGSAQADESKTLGDDYMKGVIEASRRGQAAGASLRNADENTRMNLIGLAGAGLDATTANSDAASSLLSNLQSNQASATAGDLGDMFSNLSSIYDSSKNASDYRRGLRDYAQSGTGYYKPLYGGGAGASY